MPMLTEASLTAAERQALERFVDLLRERFGEGLEAVWLYGSRSRGEPPHGESDLDLILLLGDPSDENHLEAIRLAHAAAEAEGVSTYFSVKVYDRRWVEGRRAIESFFMQEVDRDKIVLHGGP